jgi:hypothetical protein
MENMWKSLQKMKTEPYNQQSFGGMHPNCLNNHRIQTAAPQCLLHIHNSQDMETVQTSTTGWMDEELWYFHCLRQHESSWRRYAKWNKSHTVRRLLCILCVTWGSTNRPAQAKSVKITNTKRAGRVPQVVEQAQGPELNPKYCQSIK